jgi:dTDP-4-amino-4,6-dideoxygalactose transaminase
MGILVAIKQQGFSIYQHIVLERYIMKVSFYGHVRQYENIKSEIDANMAEVIQSGSYVMGPMLKKFEGELAEYAGTKYAVGVGNGTDALWLTMMALNVKPGDEVITNANTFFATVEAIWIAGGTAVLVDCAPKTKNIAPEKVKAAVTDKTVGIIPVHLYGQTSDVRAIKAIADEHKLWIIEDNAQAIDGAGKDFKQGELSDAVCTSFIIQKNLGTFGDGGAVMTNRQDLNDRIRILRNHGSAARNKHSAGFNSRLDDLHAGILSAKLKHITEWTDLRIAKAKKYSEALADVQGLTLPYTADGVRHVFHLYVVETKDEATRDALLQHLQDSGIDAKTHYSIAVHQQEGYPWGKDARIPGSLENAEHNAATCISLPMYPELTDEEQAYVIEKVKSFKGL